MFNDSKLGQKNKGIGKNLLHKMLGRESFGMVREAFFRLKGFLFPEKDKLIFLQSVFESSYKKALDSFAKENRLVDKLDAGWLASWKNPGMPSFVLDAGLFHRSPSPILLDAGKMRERFDSKGFFIELKYEKLSLADLKNDWKLLELSSSRPNEKNHFLPDPHLLKLLEEGFQGPRRDFKP